jgi:hypothetical protein
MEAYTYGCRYNFNGMSSTERSIRWMMMRLDGGDRNEVVVFG